MPQGAGWAAIDGCEVAGSPVHWSKDSDMQKLVVVDQHLHLDVMFPQEPNTAGESPRLNTVGERVVVFLIAASACSPDILGSMSAMTSGLYP